MLVEFGLLQSMVFRVSHRQNVTLYEARIYWHYTAEYIYTLIIVWWLRLQANQTLFQYFIFMID